MSNTGWVEEVDVDFDNTPDELVNLPDQVYLFDFSRVTPKKTKQGDQALEVVLKAVSVHGGGEVPVGAKSLYETISFKPDALMSAKNLLKTLGVSFPKKINFEILTELSQEIMSHRQILAKTSTQAAQNGFAAKSRVSKYFNEDSLAAATATDVAVVDSASAGAAPAGGRRRRGAAEQAAA